MFNRILAFIMLILFAVNFAYGSDYEKVQRQLDKLSKGESKLNETIDYALDTYTLSYNKTATTNISPERLALMKETFKRVARAYAQIRSGQMSQEQILRRIVGILQNRSLLVALMLGKDKRESLMIKLFIYADMQNNPELMYDEVTIDRQLKVKNSVNAIRMDKVTMVFDRGISGHQNQAIDAGEDISLRISVKNTGKTDCSNASGLLDTEDEFVTIGVYEAFYGKIPTGQTALPQNPYLLSISPACPDGYKIPFRLSIHGDGVGEFHESFFITVYNVGPIKFSNVSVSNYIPSEKDADGLLKPSEKIKFHLDITNAGISPIFDINATLNCDASFVNIPQNTLKYAHIDGSNLQTSVVKIPPSPLFQRGVRGDFDVHINKTEMNANRIPLILLINGMCHDVKYLWVEPFVIDVSQHIVEGQIAHKITPGEVINVDEMVLIPTGEFLMGNNEKYYHERPVHPIHLDAFMIDKYEVTMGQYKRFAQATGRPLPDWVKKLALMDLHPAVGVSWEDANAYAKWVGKRLPTEAEWEKAVRGGLVGKTYPWGNEQPDERCNYGNKHNGLLPVGSYPSNGYGLYDMAGNAWEWCADWHSNDYYKVSSRHNPKGPESGMNRVLRGGSWTSDEDKLRCSARSEEIPTFRNHNFGFRCAKDVSEEKKQDGD